jgi:hypothetical protein
MSAPCACCPALSVATRAACRRCACAALAPSTCQGAQRPRPRPSSAHARGAPPRLTHLVNAAVRLKHRVARGLHKVRLGRGQEVVVLDHDLALGQLLLRAVEVVVHKEALDELRARCGAWVWWAGGRVGGLAAVGAMGAACCQAMRGRPAPQRTPQPPRARAHLRDGVAVLVRLLLDELYELPHHVAPLARDEHDGGREVAQQVLRVDLDRAEEGRLQEEVDERVLAVVRVEVHVQRPVHEPRALLQLHERRGKRQLVVQRLAQAHHVLRRLGGGGGGGPPARERVRVTVRVRVCVCVCVCVCVRCASVSSARGLHRGWQRASASATAACHGCCCPRAR